jgi:cytochrome c peroxidase
MTLMRRRRRWLVLYLVFASLGFAQQATDGLARSQAYQRAQALHFLGRRMFFDPSLSRSGKISCASCHSPSFAYGPPNGMSVQRGGANMQRWGIRAVPSLRYLQVIPQFAEHSFDADITGDDSVDNGPTGGLTWDGRVDRGREQARIPLLSAYEMANNSEEQVVAAAENRPYSEELKKLSGDSEDSGAAFRTILEALEVWQQDSKEFYPYNSKYDAWLAGKAGLSDAESRGLKLFLDSKKGNCARCHIATRGVDGTPPQFTDYGFAALGVPRNSRIPANLNPRWYDLGLCGPERTDLRNKDEYCGLFMTPSLRNVAMRRAFFHNGAIHTLKEAVAFYVQRDTDPEKWYPLSNDGTILKFNDLPPKYRGNVEMGAPFGGQPGEVPALSDHDIDDIVAFLETLNDGYVSSSDLSAQSGEPSIPTNRR